MNEQRAITIWVANSPWIADAVFLRQHPVWLHHQGGILANAWKAQLLSDRANQEGGQPDFSQLSDITLHLYHVRTSRFLSGDTTMESQDIADGDVFVLLTTDSEDLENVVGFIKNTQEFPPKISTDIPRHIRAVTLKDIEELQAGADVMVKILFLSADPTDATRLRLGEELREIRINLQLAKLRDRFELEQRWSVRPADIAQALLDIQPQIVHFSGHGTLTGALCFENLLGETHPIEPGALAALFGQFKDQVKCVILNACYSEIQANAISEHTDYVIGMNQAIGDRAAIAFAVGFYQAVGAGREVEEAFQLGCVQIRLQGIPEHLTPVLMKKGQAQP